MEAICPSGPHAGSAWPAGESLETLRDGLAELSRRTEPPLREVSAFLLSLAALDSGAEGPGCFAGMLNCYDRFRQELDEAFELAQSPAGLEGTRAEAISTHLERARRLLMDAASGIPHEISQALRRAGANPGKFRIWGIDRHLDETGLLASQLGDAAARWGRLATTSSAPPISST